MNILRLLLVPFSFLYFIIVYVRNFLFNYDILKSVGYTTPVISVGNITVGGTGKTPLVIYLTEYLLSKGKSVGVISRGYKSKSGNLVVAHNGKCITSDLHSTGDELFMIVNRLSGNSKFFAIAYHDRGMAIKEMIERFSPDAIILDDAFQNRKIRKILDIVIEDKESNSFLNSFLLPAGNLRETRSALNRADLVLYNYKFAAKDSSIENFIEYSISGLYDYNENKLEIPKEKNVVLISGIANNSSFHNIVANLNIPIEKTIQYSDHYDYTLNDINKFISLHTNNVIFLTTEKDFIKIREFREFVSNYPVYYLRIDVILKNSILDNLLIKKNIV
ncbi:MAG: tetraacyldisaccharide 4'-kinase [Ignavibacteriota bacterium]|nr:tetraacyldisaccharide 4'-kinase [Ignavibacteriota bacterium]